MPIFTEERIYYCFWSRRSAGKALNNANTELQGRGTHQAIPERLLPRISSSICLSMILNLPGNFPSPFISFVLSRLCKFFIFLSRFSRRALERLLNDWNAVRAMLMSGVREPFSENACPYEDVAYLQAQSGSTLLDKFTHCLLVKCTTEVIFFKFNFPCFLNDI